MKFYASLHARSEFGNDTVPFVTALNDIREMGFAGVMMLWIDGGPVLKSGTEAAGSFLDLAQCDLKLVRKAFDDAGIEPGLIWTPVDFSDDAAALRALDRVRRLRDMALELRCQFICHSAGLAPSPGMATEEKREGLDRVARVLNTVATESAGVPVYVSVDVHYHGIAESVSDCEYLISTMDCPNAGPLLNIGHMTTCHQPGWELPQRHPERVRIVGWKDHILGKPDAPVFSVELGTGESPFEKYVSVFKRDDGIERRHSIAFENVPTPERKEALRRSLRHVEELWR
jgi:sugar phosphate isomerase/epimerase